MVARTAISRRARSKSQDPSGSLAFWLPRICLRLKRPANYRRGVFILVMSTANLRMERIFSNQLSFRVTHIGRPLLKMTRNPPIQLSFRCPPRNPYGLHTPASFLVGLPRNPWHFAGRRDSSSKKPAPSGARGRNDTLNVVELKKQNKKREVNGRLAGCAVL